MLLLLIFALPACVDNENGQTPVENPGATVSFTLTPTPSPTPFVSKPQELDLEKGQYWKFSYFTGEEEFGSNEYNVAACPEVEGGQTYIIESHLSFARNDPWWGKGFTSDATLKIGPLGNPLNYNSAEQIGSG